MDSGETGQLEELLRGRLNAFIHRTSPWHHAIHSILRRAREHDWRVFVFGGTLRDLLTHPETATPRDLDLVVSGTTSDRLRSVFSSEVMRVTRFGGLHLNLHEQPVDIWTLDSTWAFRERLVAGCDFADLPKTTFLNVEAVVAELTEQPGRPRTVYSQGFFRGIQERQVEINLEHNPFPSLCVVRALITAQRLQFSLGPRLVRFILHHGMRTPLEELEAVQLPHYGHIRLDRHELHSLLGSMREQASTLKVRPVSLPRKQQLERPSRWNLGAVPDKVHR
ncbi:hypothetical protein [Archangium lipolyticum]|uniref:hypothetical protein n=1 Tax=Archangium lipolyticum TaxID=2970465 RepID=UPI002149F857|nr:hypothetical protein [Archangium lipolyticum]